jgi:hypothetical protein
VHCLNTKQCQAISTPWIPCVAVFQKVRRMCASIVCLCLRAMVCMDACACASMGVDDAHVTLDDALLTSWHAMLTSSHAT